MAFLSKNIQYGGLFEQYFFVDDVIWKLIPVNCAHDPTLPPLIEDIYKLFLLQFINFNKRYFPIENSHRTACFLTKFIIIKRINQLIAFELRQRIVPQIHNSYYVLLIVPNVVIFFYVYKGDKMCVFFKINNYCKNADN